MSALTFRLKRLVVRLRQILCAHSYAEPRLIPVPAGRVIELRCLHCGRRKRAASLFEG